VNVSDHDLIGHEEVLGISNFCKINHKYTGSGAQGMKYPGFVIGPQFNNE
jgi:hypothetical protein